MINKELEEFKNLISNIDSLEPSFHNNGNWKILDERDPVDLEKRYYSKLKTFSVEFKMISGTIYLCKKGFVFLKHKLDKKVQKLLNIRLGIALSLFIISIVLYFLYPYIREEMADTLFEKKKAREAFNYVIIPMILFGIYFFYTINTLVKLKSSIIVRFNSESIDSIMDLANENESFYIPIDKIENYSTRHINNKHVKDGFAVLLRYLDFNGNLKQILIDNFSGGAITFEGKELLNSFETLTKQNPIQITDSVENII